ncbi:hypothetical protein HQ563_16780 [bacterium]|nr:hypothetical protein [bacterium]
MSDIRKEKSVSEAELLASAAGCVVFLEREEFIDVLKRQEEPLVVCTFKGTFRNVCIYLTRYRSLLFAHRSKSPIPLEGYELINAEEIRFCGRRLR